LSSSFGHSLRESRVVILADKLQVGMTPARPLPWAFFSKKSSKAIKTLTLFREEFAKTLNTINR